MRKTKNFLTIILLILWVTSLFGAENFTILTHKYPPYQYENNGQLTGISTALVREILRRIGHPDTIKLRGWNAGYYLTQIRPKHVLFSTTRIPEREHLFKWVGPLTSFPYYFFKKKGSPIHITRLEDAKKVSSIGTTKNYDTHLFLISKGFNNLTTISNDINNYKAFSVNRLDLIPLGELAIPFMAKQAHVKSTIFENTGVKLFDAHYYLAFSPDTSDETITKWQQALDDMKASGVYEEIYNQAVKEADEDFQVYDNQPTIVFFNPTDNNMPFWDQIETVMQAAADDLEIKLEIYRGSHNKYNLLNNIRNILYAPLKPDAIIFKQTPHANEEILKLAEQFKIPIFILKKESLEKYGTPRKLFKYWIGEMQFEEDSASVDKLLMQSSWVLILLHDYLQGFDFADYKLSFSSNQPQLTEERLAQYHRSLEEWKRLDFRKFSRKYNAKLSQDDFSLETFIRQIERDNISLTKPSDIIHLVTGEWAPYVSIKMENYGIFTSLVTAAFKEMGMETEYTFDDWVKGYDKLLDGTKVATFPYTKTPQRDKEVYFSDPVIISSYVFFYNKMVHPEEITYQTLSDLKQYHIAGVPGYFYEEKFNKEGIKYYKFHSEALAFRELYKRQIDLFPTDELVGITLLKSLYPNNYQKIFSKVSKPLLESAFHVVFSKQHPDGLEMRDIFNEGLVRIKANGLYQQIYNGLNGPQ